MIETPTLAEPKLLTTEETAHYLNVTIAFLKKDRTSPDGPSIPYVKIGKRAIRYRTDTLEEFLEQNTVYP